MPHFCEFCRHWSFPCIRQSFVNLLLCSGQIWFKKCCLLNLMILGLHDVIQDIWTHNTKFALCHFILAVLVNFVILAVPSQKLNLEKIQGNFYGRCVSQYDGPTQKDNFRNLFRDQTSTCLGVCTLTHPSLPLSAASDSLHRNPFPIESFCLHIRLSSVRPTGHKNTWKFRICNIQERISLSQYSMLICSITS